MRRSPIVGLVLLCTGLVLGMAVFAGAQTTAPSTPPADPHAGHTQAKPPLAPPSQPATGTPESHTMHGEPIQALPSFIPRLTDEDRRAAFPDVGGHAAHDTALHSFVLFDQLEWQAIDEAGGFNVDSKGWVGRDRDRLWFRGETDSESGRIGEAQAHLLYGRQISRWWDVVAGVRQDVRPGPAQTWAAIGVQGLAPYWFEVEATAYVGPSGRTHARVEVEYDLRFTNRLILQPLLEVEVFGTSDPERGVGAGLSTTQLGLRLRYEWRREFAPYAGVTWNRKYGKTADVAAAGDVATGARLAAGVRLWF